MTSHRLMAITSLVLALGGAGCGGPCKDLAARKGDCAKAGPARLGCEEAIDNAVRGGNADACTLALTGVDKMVAAGKQAPPVGAPAVGAAAAPK